MLCGTFVFYFFFNRGRCCLQNAAEREKKKERKSCIIVEASEQDVSCFRAGPSCRGRTYLLDR